MIILASDKLGKLIAKEIKKGHPQDQAIAIAYSTLGKGKKKK